MVQQVLEDIYEFTIYSDIREQDLCTLEEITGFSEALARYGAQVLRAAAYPRTVNAHIGLKDGSAQTDTPPNPTPATNTYAAAASGPTSAPRPVPPAPHRAPSPAPRKRAARGGHRADTAPPVKGPPPTAQPPPRAPGNSHRRGRSASRVIVRYRDADILRGRTKPHSAVLLKSLNDALGGDWVAGIAYSRNDRLILHTKSPYSARELALQGGVLRPVIRSAFAFMDDPEPLFETDDPWSKIVVQRVPLPLLSDSTEHMEDKAQAFLADACSSNGFTPDVVRRMQFLCPKGKEEEYFSRSTAQAPQLVSVLLCLSDSRLANRLLRTGAFWQGSHCRVSLYRERRRTANG
ncbi:hypothetical protein EXIGLDRAFT_724734 [Exidia glandulosa HHB12029]|uniref:Uncharacterized protein n=1 Tax=Exidia glandulosa HHB12029 TaxID=1314781 RepID=A0A165EBH6_EXIGL|nr:hypothetical protein EXIGLDRAFT_724734 [Exidia glandulosa HHB12029]